LIQPGNAPPPAVGPSVAIDLPRALQIGRANNMTIALARNRIASAEVAVKQAQLRWLPDLQFGPTYLLHDGLIQRAPGEIIDTHRQSLLIGGGPSFRLELNEGIMLPRIARSLARAAAAAEVAVTNQTLLEVAENYLDLLAAYSSAEIAREATDNALKLFQLTEDFEKTGAGLPSDTARARAELETRRQQLERSAERIAVSSVMLAQPLYLNPSVLLVPAESSVYPIELVADTASDTDLIAQGLRARPELAEHRALVDVAVKRLTQTKLRPLLPSLNVGFTSGGFGGGATGFPGGMDGRFGGRDDLSGIALWEVRGLGFGEVAARQQGRIQVGAAEIKLTRTINEVMAQVAAAHKAAVSRRRQVDRTEQAVAAASRSHELNRRRIEGGAGLPIEVLQSIQALERARTEYLNAVTSYNKAQFRLLTAIGTTPAAPVAQASPTIERSQYR
jgi:outer membrane protein TolC